MGRPARIEISDTRGQRFGPTPGVVEWAERNNKRAIHGLLACPGQTGVTSKTAIRHS